MRNTRIPCVLGILIIITALSTWVCTSIYLAVTKNTFAHYNEMSAVVIAAITMGAGMLAKKGS